MYTSNYYDVSSSYTLLNILSTWLVLILILFVLLVVAEWKIFTKAGKPGWASIVPFYSTYVKFDAFWGDTRYFWLYLVMVLTCTIPVIGYFMSVGLVVMNILLSNKIAKSFGKDVGFTLGLIFLPNIFTMILAFGKAEYIGAPSKSETEVKAEEKVEEFVKDNFSKEKASSENPVIDAEVVNKTEDIEKENTVEDKNEVKES